jgi:hypothetical protein
METGRGFSAALQALGWRLSVSVEALSITRRPDFIATPASD